MLSKQEIMLIRAALQFWYEEMDLDDADLFAIYSGGPRIKPSWRVEDIQRLRQQLNEARLRYAVCHSDATRVKIPHLFDTPAAANQAMADGSDRLGVVLVDAPAV
ncbi:hypothetical protein Enr10x_53900 [Gimesia panareensis]|uniref:Uncharacterized protein n=1 Tax=Gimesia panareensis TaxID=2527978 RepID=A0A517QEH6_9PLAN|nr:hypothetical protein [Gimesia panareensis]QDT30031.1 hypothetical protein Enr10x_53900 [Gimesia panareensis]